MKRDWKAAWFAVAGLAIALSANGVGAQEIRWDMSTEYGETSITARADKLFAERLKENSGGRMVVTVHYGGALGFRSLDHWAAVEDGAVPLASSYGGVFTGIDPIFLLTSMPFLAKNPVEARSLLQASWEQYQEAFARSNQVLLFSEPFVPGGIWSRNPVRTPEDLKGLRVRSFDANGTRIVAEVGGSPVQMTWSDVVTGLATGAIDAVLAGISPGLAASFPEHIKHYNEIGYVMGSAMVHMNRDVFEGLSDEDKKILMDTARQVEDEVWANVVEELKGDVGRAEAAGVTVDLAPQPELLKVLMDASAPVLEEWKAKMPAGVADGILERYRKILAEKQ